MAKVHPDWATLGFPELVLGVSSGSVPRKLIRRRIFKIRAGNDKYDNGLKDFLEKQFDGEMEWDNFTFLWDIAPNDPLRVIRQVEWVAEGGQIYKLLRSDGTVYYQCDPTGFTNQE